MDQVKSLDFKNKKTIITLAVFAVLFIGAILIGSLVLHQPIVTVTVVMLLEVCIAVCLHHVELWIHGAVLIVELIIGALIPDRILLVVVCVVMYAVTIAALKVLYGQKK